MSSTDVELRERQEAELLEVRSLAPAAVGIFTVLCLAPDFPQSGEPLQRLKNYLASKDLTPSLWKLVLRDGDQVIALVHQFYCGKQHLAVLNALRVLNGLEVDRMIPLWLAQALFGEYGNAGSPKSDYYRLMGPVMPKLRHMTRVVQSAFEQPSDKQEMDVSQVVHWLTEPGLPALSISQRQQGWNWLVKKSVVFCALEDERRAVNGVAWPVPFKTFLWDNWELVAMGSTTELLEEGRLMRNCVGSLSKRCADGNELLLSVRGVAAKREATLHCKWQDGRWSFVNALGPMNRMLPVTVTQRLKAAVTALPVVNAKHNGGFDPDCAPGHVGESAKTEIDT